MSSEQHRYVQPTGPKDAMTIIQKLFNQYRNAPLTAELLAYHQNLVKRLHGDIQQAVDETENDQLAKDLASMTAVMESWTAIRLARRPFPGKMHHFKLDVPTSPHFKVKNHKIGSNHNGHRSSRH